MSAGSIALHGVVRGNGIEIEEPLGLPDGQRVTIRLETTTAAPAAGEGLARSAGGWSDDPEGLDEYLRWNRQRRKQGRPEIGP